MQCSRLWLVVRLRGICQVVALLQKSQETNESVAYSTTAPLLISEEAEKKKCCC